MNKQICYRFQLYRYRQNKGWEEETIITNFFPSLINGFTIILNKLTNGGNKHGEARSSI